MEYRRADWCGNWQVHGGISQEALAKAKCDRVGDLLCPYTNELVDMADTQLDHVIPLGWLAHYVPLAVSAHARQVMGHDPDNLLLVSARANESKGERGPSAWLPPYHPFRRPYAVIWRYCLYKFGLEAHAPRADLQVLEDLLNG